MFALSRLCGLRVRIAALKRPLVTFTTRNKRPLTLTATLICGGGIFAIKFANQKALCKSRIVDRKVESKAKFEWKRFLNLLIPHLKYLMGAILSALIVAALNIKSPQRLGDVVNAALNNANFASEALQLVKLYLLQGGFTFAYIYTLSIVGERVAAQMRKVTLIHSYLGMGGF